jgi:nucleoside-diphosphate-sugar epimerase
MQAERMVLDAIETGQLRGAIFRPSVVFGDSAEGKLIHYVGPYQVARTWHCLNAAGSELGKPDKVVRVAVDLEHSLNLIPLDTATDAMIELSETDRGNRTVFNIVNKKEVPLENAFGAIVRNTGFETVLCSREELRRSPRSVYESLVSYSLDYISPYVNHKVAFETKETETLLKREISVDVYPDLYTRSIGAYLASLRSASAN